MKIHPSLSETEIYSSEIKDTPTLCEWSGISSVRSGSLTPLMLAAQHGREDVVNGLISKMMTVDKMKRSFDNKTAAQLALEQGFYKIAYTLRTGLSAEERIQALSNSIPGSSAIIASHLSPLTVALGQMITEVTHFKTEFTIQAESKRRETAAATRGEETDDDQTESLDMLTAEILPRASWRKPTNPQDQKTGRRMLLKTFFEGDRRQQLTQLGQLRGKLLTEGGLVMVPDCLDGEDCLVVDTVPRRCAKQS